MTFLVVHSFSAYLLQTNPLVFAFLITNNYLFLQKLSPLRMIIELIFTASIWYLGAILLDVFRSLIFKIISLGIHLLSCYLIYRITKKSIFVLMFGHKNTEREPCRIYFCLESCTMAFKIVSFNLRLVFNIEYGDQCN